MTSPAWTHSITVPGPPSGSEQTADCDRGPASEANGIKNPPLGQQEGTNPVPQLSSPPDQKGGSTNLASEPEAGSASGPTPKSAQPAATSSGAPPTANDIIAALPPRPPSNLDLPGATVGAPYHAELPAFSDLEGKGLRLSADGLPEGIDFSDLGDGRGAIGGVPTRVGKRFDPGCRSQPQRTNRANDGEGGHQRTNLDPAPPSIRTLLLRHHLAAREHAKLSPSSDSTPKAASPPGRPSPASPNSTSASARTARSGRAVIKPPPTSSPAEKARQFVAGFNGGECFLIKRLGESGGKESYLGFGLDQSPFERFDTGYKNQVGAEAEIRGVSSNPTSARRSS